MIGSEKFHRMTEADAFGPHDPVDRRPARVACAQAVPEVLRRSDDQRGCPVVVEGALTHQVGSVPRQLDTPRLGQPLDRDFFLEPFDLVIRDARHVRPSCFQAAC
jgi:hypothetical protein